MRRTTLRCFSAAAHAAACVFLSATAAAGAGSAPPPNAPAVCEWNEGAGALKLAYRDGVILDAKVSVRAGGAERAPAQGEVVLTRAVASEEKVEQRLELAFARDAAGAELCVRGIATGSEEAFPAEMRTEAQRRFAYVRNSVGLSANARNNAVYDRMWDWVLVGPGDGRTRIAPHATKVGGIDFAWESRGATVELVFKPRFYQKHKRLAYFEPWNYRVRRDSVTGWCSWWAYRADFSRKDLEQVVGVMAEKRFGDFGYRFIQIDDAYQGGSGTPQSWLEWNAKFPGGIADYARTVREKGFEPAIWVGVFFKDQAIVTAHPDWFVRKADGKPFKGPWIEYGLDATVQAVADTLIRPTYRGFHEQGFTYVKIDALRHLLYDSLHVAPQYGRDRGLEGDAIFRRYLALAREELGPGTFVLACWGVLPEAIGFADGCRLGGDGFGPCTMQQYNSWNGIVWRNDPDHCDVVTRPDAAHTTKVVVGGRTLVCPSESILRPVLASFAGAMLMLSDRPAVYARDENLEGAKRASPVLFTVPGQLYDFDPSKSDKVIALARAEVTSGGPPSPIDADQSGAICPWWMLEIDRPFERWSVLARMNWAETPMAEARVAFADLGLPGAEYLVYEFWSRKFLGVCREGFTAAAVQPLGMHAYALRAKLERPQIVATSRHVSQGAVDLEGVAWNDATRTLSGRSHVVRADSYELVIHAPAPFTFASAKIDGKDANTIADGALVRVAFTPSATAAVAWEIQFK